MLHDTSIETPAPAAATDAADGLSPNIAKWVAALRSGRYKQGSGQLRKGDHFCVLGVACDISGLGEWVPGYDNADTEFMDYKVGSGARAGGHLPDEVIEWLGVKDYFASYGRPGEMSGSISDANDRGVRDFPMLATLIEAIDTQGLWRNRGV